MTWGRLVVRTVGELLVTAGALVLLFVVWQLWWTDVQASATADQALEQLQQSFAEPDPAAPSPDPAPVTGTPTAAPGDGADPAPTRDDAPPAYEPGDGVAIVHLPSIDQTVAVQEGVTLDVLNRGVLGRYPHSGMPGEVGNFAVAGHRTTYGRPLWDLDSVRVGEPVVVETAAGWSVYVMQRHRVVLPHETEVVAPVPDHPGAEPTEAWMVLTACHPRFSAAERLVGYALLDRTVPRDQGPPPELTEDA
jgi:sortase A